MLNNGADAFLSTQGLKRFHCSHNLLTSGTVPWTTVSLLPKLLHLLLDSNRFGECQPGDLPGYITSCAQRQRQPAPGSPEWYAPSTGA
jgi:hypothetical protein